MRRHVLEYCNLPKVYSKMSTSFSVIANMPVFVSWNCLVLFSNVTLFLLMEEWEALFFRSYIDDITQQGVKVQNSVYFLNQTTNYIYTVLLNMKENHFYYDLLITFSETFSIFVGSLTAKLCLSLHNTVFVIETITIFCHLWMHAICIWI